MVIIGMDSNVGLRGRNQGLPNRASSSEIADENNPNAVSRHLRFHIDQSIKIVESRKPIGMTDVVQVSKLLFSTTSAFGAGGLHKK
ncbi:uncharacterized protein Bfra_002418 [Botrytis fragariae]|uniref:Uncharacterized protein n=1 Tax=Botrytis fragariae TaxID=1964551 RepID=A0A8H6AYP7_9HELO|nr:uncharacterized protein Bfra_002418 [Botrytis fragariae]KAF5876021.1 hypothetical protein Bfra_002418 [Botrytis fragariae]